MSISRDRAIFQSLGFLHGRLMMSWGHEGSFGPSWMFDGRFPKWAALGRRVREGTSTGCAFGVPSLGALDKFDIEYEFLKKLSRLCGTATPNAIRDAPCLPCSVIVFLMPLNFMLGCRVCFRSGIRNLSC